MESVLILTKTNWSEAPRIRHQITRLFKDKGYKIVYVEKNAYKNIFIKTRKEEAIEFYAHSELIHHQLRYFPIIQWANNLVVKYYLKKIIRRIEFDFIMNFCYDYSFLKELVPDKKIITMVEDDFESQAKFGMTGQIRNQVKATCTNSDAVLTVSYPLFDKLSTYNSNVKMLFPWSQSQYKPPSYTGERNTVLYFGFIHRMDWVVVEKLVSNTKYHYRFIGPTARWSDVRMINHLVSTYPNFEYIQYSTIKDLKLDDIFCSILPYDPRIKSVQACTISNRAFNLLSFGLPLVYADLHHLIEAPDTVIRKNQSLEDYLATMEFFKVNFYDLQADIQSFLGRHYENDRWMVLEETINEDMDQNQ
jgi:hypothetical protein